MPLTPRDGLALAGAALAALALGAAAWLILAPPQSAMIGGGDPVELDPSLAGAAASRGPEPGSPAAELLVDVQGAVARPGLVRLPPGARVADAVAAAGGYAQHADLLAAATAINLASPLADGDQVFVPILGVAGAGGSGSGTGDGEGLVDLNTASPEALEALPGIGPVTVQKIVAARQERAFATLEELVERKVMNAGQLEQIRDLVTV